MRNITAFVLVSLLTACGGKNDKKESAIADNTNKSTPPVVTNNNDTLVINKNMAVYYIPDSSQMSAWKKKVGEKDFETVADDWSFYMNSATEYLKKTPVPVEDASGKKWLKFIKADQSITLVGLDTLSNYWGYFLFNPVKEPQYADIVMMEESYKKYFK